MFIKARPDYYVTDYMLINTDNIEYVCDCYSNEKKFRKTRPICLLVRFSSGEEIVFQGLSREKFERILTQNNRDAIVSALEEVNDEYEPE